MWRRRTVRPLLTNAVEADQRSFCWAEVSDDGTENAPLAPELAEWFTVYNYARRGRGDSGNTLPYAVQREIEDIEALIAEAGGSAHLYGVSSGGALVLEAGQQACGVRKPYGFAGDRQERRAYVEQVEALLAEGRLGDALALFMRTAGSSEEDIARARCAPIWPDREALAHTLAYDAPAWETARHRPPASRRSRDRPWSSRAG